MCSFTVVHAALPSVQRGLCVSSALAGSGAWEPCGPGWGSREARGGVGGEAERPTAAVPTASASVAQF